MRVRRSIAGAGSLLAVATCHLAAGLDGYEKVDASGQGASASSATSGGAPGGQGGAGGAGAGGQIQVTAAFDYGDSTPQHSVDVGLLSANQAAVVGAFNGKIFSGADQLTASFPDTLFVAAVGDDGTTAWTNKLDATVTAPRVAIGPTGIVVAGLAEGASLLDFGNDFNYMPSTTPSAFVVRYDMGLARWVQQLSNAGGPFEVTTLQARAGRVLVAGTFQGAVLETMMNTTGGEDDGFVAAFDWNDGNIVWGVQLREPNPPPAVPQRVHGGGIDASGYAYVAGSFVDEVAFNNGCILTMSTALFVAKYDTMGMAMNCRMITHALTAELSAVTVSENGAIALAGTFAGNIDFGGRSLIEANRVLFVALLNSDLSPVWAVKSSPLGLNSTTRIRDLAFDEAGNVIAAGTLDDSVTLGSFALTAMGPGEDVLLARYAASDGEVQGAARFGDGATAGATGVDALGGVTVVGGSFDGTIDFGTGVLQAEGSAPDAFVAWFGD